MENTLNLSLAAEYDIVVERDRTLNLAIECTDTEGNLFDFTPYTGATMMIKNTAGTIIMTFSLEDESIKFEALGIFILVKSAEEMLVPRAGQYNYDLYLTSERIPKRNFLRGKITFIQHITN